MQPASSAFRHLPQVQNASTSTAELHLSPKCFAIEQKFGELRRREEPTDYPEAGVCQDISAVASGGVSTNLDGGDDFSVHPCPSVPAKDQANAASQKNISSVFASSRVESIFKELLQELYLNQSTCNFVPVRHASPEGTYQDGGYNSEGSQEEANNSFLSTYGESSNPQSPLAITPTFPKITFAGILTEDFVIPAPLPPNSLPPAKSHTINPWSFLSLVAAVYIKRPDYLFLSLRDEFRVAFMAHALSYPICSVTPKLVKLSCQVLRLTEKEKAVEAALRTYLLFERKLQPLALFLSVLLWHEIPLNNIVEDMMGIYNSLHGTPLPIDEILIWFHKMQEWKNGQQAHIKAVAETSKIEHQFFAGFVLRYCGFHPLHIDFQKLKRLCDADEWPALLHAAVMLSPEERAHQFTKAQELTEDVKQHMAQKLLQRIDIEHQLEHTKTTDNLTCFLCFVSLALFGVPAYKA